MPQGLPRTAGALLLSALGLSALALFFGDGSTYAPLVWIGGLTVFAAGVVLALVLWGPLSFPRLDGPAVAFLTLLAWFVVWNGLSIVWSVTPDRSWEYFNRGIVYFAFAVLGVCVGVAVPRAPRAVAVGLLAVFGAVLVWALAGKVIPNLYPDAERISRLRAPLDYWNALALVAAMTMPLGLWAAGRREHARGFRIAAVLLVFVAAVALLLTYSRGGGIIALLALAAYLVLCRERVDAIAAMVVALLPAIALGAWAFTQPGLVEDAQPYDRRLDDGLQLGVGLLLVGTLVAGLAYLGLRNAERWRPRFAMSIAGPRVAGAALVFLLVGVLAVSRGDPVAWARDGFREFTNPVSDAGGGPARLGDFSSNSRWTWWEEAWEIWKENPLIGTGAGSFVTARKPFRANTTVATEPHNLALQFLSETGLVGFLLALGAGVGVAWAIVRSIRRLDERDAAAAIPLAVLALAYVAHGLVDYDWDFVSVSAPLFLVLGVLIAAGRPPLPKLEEPFYAAGAALLSVAVLVSLASPWFARRKVADAYAAIERGDAGDAVGHARRARTFNPLSVDPLFGEAAGEELRRNDRAASDLYIRAVELQPQNPLTWYELGRFEYDVGLRDAAIRHMRRSLELDRWGPARRYLEQLGIPVE
jgi:tetratricopeptide (TPR) repeat protein